MSSIDTSIPPLPPISIVIPVFNQWHFTEPCLQALARTIPAAASDNAGIAQPHAGRKHQIIIVDNGSTDKTRQQLESVANKEWGHAYLTYIRFDENRGFNEASNAGAQAAAGEVLVFLNNDTVPQNGWLEALWAALILPKVGIVGPKLLFPDTQTINHIGYSFNLEIGGYFPLYFEMPATFPPVCKPREFQALLGACLMIRREDFFAVGMFSLTGLEDIDLCLKIRETGKRVLYTPRAEVWHHGGATFLNSDAALIPKTTTEEFNRRWPTNTLIRDDEKFYREDGFSMSLDSERRVTLNPEHPIAKELFEKGQAAIATGALNDAIKFGQQSLEIYPRNIQVIKQVALWLVDAGRASEAELLRHQLLFLSGLA